jgi:hypothetical protein
MVRRRRRSSGGSWRISWTQLNLELWQELVCCQDLKDWMKLYRKVKRKFLVLVICIFSQWRVPGGREVLSLGDSRGRNSSLRRKRSLMVRWGSRRAVALLLNKF